MTQTLTVENETHWKTSDIKRIIRSAINAAEADPKRPRQVKVTWQTKGSRVSYRFTNRHDPEGSKIFIYLPRKGPKLLHHNALIALAAAGIAAETPMLAVSDSFFLANALAWELSREVGMGDIALKVLSRSTAPPSWTNSTTLIITKYADPKKDGTFVAFSKRKLKDIASADERIAKWQAELERAKKNLARAKKDKKKAATALAAAKKRRA
jgi:uncharacterized small protein (DUF1192 family)